MEKLEALTIKIDSQIINLNEELEDMRKKYNELRNGNVSKIHLNDDTSMCERHEANYIQSEGNKDQNSHDSFSHQSLHDPNDSEKSLTELKNDVRNDLEDFKRHEWSKYQNVSSEQTNWTEPQPPSIAHTEQVNAVFTGSEKSDYSLKTQKDSPPPIIVIEHHMARSGTDLKMAKLLASAAIYVKMGVLYYAFLNKISEHATESLSVILQLEPKKLVRSDNVPTPRDTRASPYIAKELIVTPVSKSLELSVNVVPASSIVASERNEEQVYAAVDGSDLEMADSVVPSKSGGVFVQGVSRILDDVVEVAAVESERVSSGPTDVVVALSVDGKGDVLIPSSVAGEEAVINSSGQILSHATSPKSNGFPPGTFSIAGQAFTITSEPPYMPEKMFISYVRIHYKLLVFPSSLVVICSLYDVVVHWSPLLGRRDHCVSSSGLML
ncbi:hypothetical protein Tco_1239671, partial [Tanacetum coccineum]